MHDFSCTNPDDMNYEALAKKARYFKQDEKGVATMCKISPAHAGGKNSYFLLDAKKHMVYNSLFHDVGTGDFSLAACNAGGEQGF